MRLKDKVAIITGGGSGIGQAIAETYAAAGADLLFVEAPESEDDLTAIARQVRAPLLVNMFQGGRTPLVAPNVLEAMGYRAMIVPSDLQRAAIRAMQDAATAVKTSGTAAGLGHAWRVSMNATRWSTSRRGAASSRTTAKTAHDPR